MIYNAFLLIRAIRAIRGYESALGRAHLRKIAKTTKLENFLRALRAFAVNKIDSGNTQIRS
jgi:hypothetical protein